MNDFLYIYPVFTQNLNRYSYVLNNPLKFTDPSGDKWKWQWLNPFFHFQNFMQWVNDKTPKLRQEMANAGIPDFSVGGSINGNGNVYFSGNYAGQEVFNTQKIDRSNAVQVVSREIAQVNYVDGAAWHAQGGGGNIQYAGIEGGEHFIGPSLILLGQPLNALKPIGALGSKPGSSIASYTLSKTFPQTFTKVLGKQTGTKIATSLGTNVIGRAAGRFVPYLVSLRKFVIN